MPKWQGHPHEWEENMGVNGATALAIALSLTTATGVFGQQTLTKGQSVTSTATIQAIDSTARTVTLLDDRGQTDTYSAGTEVQRFDELKVGDKVKITYYESTVLQIRKPGETPGAAATEAALTRGKGALPAATYGVQDKMTVTVKSIDPEMPSITVTTPDGRVVTRKVENKKNLEGVKVGDQIDITYTRAFLTSVERGQ
jgi:Cu/Ag efflux protein CusF